MFLEDDKADYNADNHTNDMTITHPSFYLKKPRK